MSVICHKSTATFLEDKYNSRFFPEGGELPRDRFRLNICFSTGTSISEQPLIIKLGISPGPTGFIDFEFPA
jgi:hypothetical protein